MPADPTETAAGEPPRFDRDKHGYGQGWRDLRERAVTDSTPATAAPTPGVCAAPGCPVLHDDPSDPVHPPWALEDVYDRLRRADRELRDMALGAIGTTARDRLKHKADGVRLALSYVEEAIRAH